MGSRTGRSSLRLLALALLLVLAPACSGSDGVSLLGDPPGTGKVTRAEAQHLLDDRARAIRGGDLDLFLQGIDPSRKPFVRRERTYFANLQKLPLAELDFEVLEGEWPETLRAADWDATVYQPQVQAYTQLADFDAEPVVRTTGFAFGRVDGRALIISDRTGAGVAYPGSSPAPWDLVKIEVQDAGDILAIYDTATWGRADQIGDTIRRGITDLQALLPFAWDGRVVAYVFRKESVLDSFDVVPGGNISHLGAMTFPVYASASSPDVAAIRFVLLPGALSAGQDFLDRITRHELTHVAMGDRDDGVPTWLAEGIAEFLSVRNVPEGNRRIASVAVSKARKGADSMPPTRGFNGPDQTWHYALSWMACEYIVDHYNEATLWRLVDAMHAGGDGTTDAEQDVVLQTVLGIDGEQLAGEAAERIRRIYG